MATRTVFGIRAIAIASLVAVAVAGNARGQGSPTGPVSPEDPLTQQLVAQQSAEAFADKQAEVSGPGAAEERVRSRMAFAGVDREAALVVARRAFPDLLTDPQFEALPVDASGPMEFVGDSAAVISTPGGGQGAGRLDASVAQS